MQQFAVLNALLAEHRFPVGVGRRAVSSRLRVGGQLGLDGLWEVPPWEVGIAVEVVVGRGVLARQLLLLCRLSLRRPDRVAVAPRAGDALGLLGERVSG